MLSILQMPQLTIPVPAVILASSGARPPAGTMLTNKWDIFNYSSKYLWLLIIPCDNCGPNYVIQNGRRDLVQLAVFWKLNIFWLVIVCLVRWQFSHWHTFQCNCQYRDSHCGDETGVKLSHVNSDRFSIQKHDSFMAIHWGRDMVVTILQTTYPNSFSN